MRKVNLKECIIKFPISKSIAMTTFYQVTRYQIPRLQNISLIKVHVGTELGKSLEKSFV